ncbi:MAG: tetratricopeptide repeat protein, partial [Thermodesulfobacteriota bacterium]
RFSFDETIPPYLLTHPELQERLFMVENMVKDTSVKREARNLETLDWKRIVTILQAKDGKEITNVKLNSIIAQEDNPLSEEQRHYLSGLLAFKSGHLNNAVSEYQEAIRINSDNPIYHADLALIYIKQQKTAIAKEEAIKSLKLSDDYASPHVVLGTIAQVNEHHEIAIKHLEEAEKHAPGDPFIQFQLARSYHILSMSVKELVHLGCYYRLNLEPENALRQFNKALALIEGDEDNPLGQNIKREIREIKREGI